MVNVSGICGWLKNDFRSMRNIHMFLDNDFQLLETWQQITYDILKSVVTGCQGLSIKKEILHIWIFIAIIICEQLLTGIN